MMHKHFDNIGTADRLARFVLGAILIAMIFSPNFNSTWVSLLSIYPIMTAIMAWDPIYAYLQKLASNKSAKQPTLSHATA